MSVAISAGPLASDPVQAPAAAQDWAGDTRRVLIRDLLVRAAHAGHPGEARSLEFRALHLSLPLVGTVAARMGLCEEQRRAVEHHALDGLLDAVRLFDPFGPTDFEDFAQLHVERAIRAHLPRAALRLAVHRVALAIARA